MSLEQALIKILDSIASEQTALASFINAEAKKIQASTTKMSAEEIIHFQKSVASVMQTAIKMQMLLHFKLDKILDAQEKISLIFSSQNYGYALTGSGKGTVSNPDSTFLGGNANLQVSANSISSNSFEENFLAYKVQNLGNQLNFAVEPNALHIRCPYNLHQNPSPENPNMLILTGEGKVTRNAPTRSDTASFTLTVWDGGLGPPGTDKFQLTIKADNNEDLDHDSGVINVLGDLIVSKSRG